jgi:transcription antitermination factor NusG
MNTFWYIVKVLPGKERQLNEHFNQQIGLNKIKDIRRFVCPVEQEVITTKNKKILRDKVIYSGYLYFETENKLDDSQLKEISTIPNIMGMMGDKTPRLMKEVDVKKILKDEVLSSHNESRKLKYHTGDIVMIYDGPFTGFEGQIIDVRGEVVDVIVKIFGRDTKVTLTMSQIKK